MADQRVLRNRKATISVTFEADEAGVDADGSVTIGITKADGSTLVAAGTATTKRTGATGVYDYVLTPQANLNSLTATWNGTFGGVAESQTTSVEIVGAFYVTLNEIRRQVNLNDHGKFTTQDLRTARQWFEDKFEEHTGVAWVPRFARDRATQIGSSFLKLPRVPVRSVLSVRTYTSSTVSSAFSAGAIANLDVSWDVVRTLTGYEWNVPTFNVGAQVIVEYEHGVGVAAPTDVKKAALVAIRDVLLGDNIGNRQYAVVSGDEVIRVSTASQDRPFGIPFCDAVANARRMKGRGAQSVPLTSSVRATYPVSLAMP